jgi:hypothetical protein
VTPADDGFPPFSLLIGTKDGFYTFDCDGRLEATPVTSALAGHAVRGIAVHPDDRSRLYVGCGLPGFGLHETGDGGRTFREIAFGDRWVWDVWLHPATYELWAGTEPPMLFRARRGADGFTPCEQIDSLSSRPRWSFFHPPFYAGHIHGIAAHPERPERIFAGVEHGALVFTHDDGETWHETFVGGDLHRVAVDPQDPDRVLAGTGVGLFVSSDAGTSWSPRPVLAGYVHSILFDPRRPRRMFVYTGGLHRSDDAGRTWQTIGDGLPGAGPVDSLALDPSGAVLVYGAGADGVFASLDAGDSWRRVELDVPRIWRLRTAAPLEAA